MSIAAAPSKSPTEKQGQYLAFIHAYSVVTGRPPAEAWHSPPQVDQPHPRRRAQHQVDD